MILILKPNLEMIQMYVCTEMKFLSSVIQKLWSEQEHRKRHKQPDRQIDLTEINSYHICGCNNKKLYSMTVVCGS